MERNFLNPGLNLIKIIGDILFVNLSIVIAFLLRFHGELPWYNFKAYVIISPAISLLAIVLFNFYGLYRTLNKLWAEVMASLIVSIGILALSAVALSYMIQSYSFPRTVFLISVVVQLVVLGVWRWFMLKYERRIIPPLKVLVIAPADDARILCHKLRENRQDVIGIVIENFRDGLQCDAEVLGTYENIEEVCNLYRPDAVYISGKIPEEFKEKISRVALSLQIQLFVVPGLYEIMLFQARLDPLQDIPIFQISFTKNTLINQLKRIMDFVVAFICLLLVLPIMIVIAVLIKLTSPGPVFYTQERVGENGNRFIIYKFRTMVNDAEKYTGPVLADKDDPRITVVGRFLRTTRMDEIPQLFNVLKGDMSIVGPRPERPVFVEQFEKGIPDYNYRHLTRVGITGLAQVSGRYSTNPEDKLRYDLLYAKKASILLDLQIILQTIKILLIRDRAS